MASSSPSGSGLTSVTCMFCTSLSMITGLPNRLLRNLAISGMGALLKESGIFLGSPEVSVVGWVVG